MTQQEKLNKVISLFLDYLKEHEYAGIWEPPKIDTIKKQLENLIEDI